MCNKATADCGIEKSVRSLFYRQKSESGSFAVWQSIAGEGIDGMVKGFKLSVGTVLAAWGILFCAASVCGCGGSGQKKTEDVSENGEDVHTEEFDRYDLTLAYNDYEKDYETELEVENETIAFELWSSNIGCQVIKIGSQEIPLKSGECMLGGAGLELMTCDVTDDRTEEIILVESQGASGAFQYLRVFGNTGGQWEERKLPSELYSDADDLDSFLQQEELGRELNPSVYSKYRTISLDEQRILVDYWLFQDTDSETVDAGRIQKELLYSSDQKKFTAGNTRYLPAENQKNEIPEWNGRN